MLVRKACGKKGKMWLLLSSWVCLGPWKNRVFVPTGVQPPDFYLHVLWAADKSCTPIWKQGNYCDDGILTTLLFIINKILSNQGRWSSTEPKTSTKRVSSYIQCHLREPCYMHLWISFKIFCKRPWFISFWLCFFTSILKNRGGNWGWLVGWRTLPRGLWPDRFRGRRKKWKSCK